MHDNIAQDRQTVHSPQFSCLPNIVTISDTSSDTFNALLKYIYGHDTFDERDRNTDKEVDVARIKKINCC